ncbi:MAG: glycogen synthase, partial [Fusobacteriaceae bacterium]
MPKFSAIGEKFKLEMKKILSVEVDICGQSVGLDLETLHHEGIIYYFVSNDFYFNRDKVFGEVDDCERFAVFSKAVLEILKFLDWVPEIIHCNNAVSGLIPVYLEKIKKENGDEESIYSGMSTLFTVHSLKHQGFVSYNDFKEILDLDEKTYFIDSIMKYYDGASILKGAVYFADAVNVVSANYLKEITTDSGSGDLSGFFDYHKKKMVGIKNGIDGEIFDPKKDGAIVQNYGYTTLERRKNNKLALQKELGLDIHSDVPIIAVLSKLDDERGINLLKQGFVELLMRDVQIVIIGGGEEKYEDYFDYYSTVMPNRVYTQSFDFNGDKLSRRIF